MQKQKGFVLIVCLLMLAAISIIALGGMASTTVGERIAGSYTDRSRAYLAAEQALTQGMAFLRANSVTCLENICDNTNLVGAAAQHASATLPSAWSNANSVSITLAANQGTSASYLINYLGDATYAKINCRPYSIMGRGVGLNSASAVILQTVAYICPTD